MIIKKTKDTIKKSVKIKKEKPKKYYEAVGSRKTAVARVRLFTTQPFQEEKGKIMVNNKPYFQYFNTLQQEKIIEASFNCLKLLNRFEASVKVRGGGKEAQAEAVRHGIAKALVKFNPNFRKKLKKAGYLKRDPRKKERKKPGLKKARRAPQWSKR